eukprot:EG_transcript_14930
MNAPGHVLRASVQAHVQAGWSREQLLQVLDEVYAADFAAPGPGGPVFLAAATPGGPPLAPPKGSHWYGGASPLPLPPGPGLPLPGRSLPVDTLGGMPVVTSAWDDAPLLPAELPPRLQPPTAPQPKRGAFRGRRAEPRQAVAVPAAPWPLPGVAPWPA